MEPSCAINRVKFGSSTTTKVSGLTPSIRDQYLGLLADALKKNVEVAQDETPDNDLVYKDFEDIASEIEYLAFTKSTVISLYKRHFIKSLGEVKNASALQQLYPLLKSHQPKKRKAMGGDYETIVEDIRKRFGDEVVESLEADKKDKVKEKLKECKKKLMRVTPGVNKDFLNQSKISTFFNKPGSSKVEPDSSPVEISDDNDVSETKRTEKRKFENDVSDKAEDVKPKLLKLDATDRAKTPENVKTPQIELTISPSLLKDSPEYLSEPEINPEPVHKPKVAIVKPHEPSRIPAAIKIPPVVPHKMIKLEKTSTPPQEKTRTPLQKKTKTPPQKTNTPPQEQKEDKQKKRATSDAVIKYLMPFYKAGRIRTKDLFKGLARNLTHKFCSDKVGEYLGKNKSILLKSFPEFLLRFRRFKDQKIY
jgi:hypothetical protein